MTLQSSSALLSLIVLFESIFEPREDFSSSLLFILLLVLFNVLALLQFFFCRFLAFRDYIRTVLLIGSFHLRLWLISNLIWPHLLLASQRTSLCSEGFREKIFHLAFSGFSPLFQSPWYRWFDVLIVRKPGVKADFVLLDICLVILL